MERTLALEVQGGVRRREGCVRVEPLDWKVQGAGSSTPRPDTPSGCGKKNVGGPHGAQIEHLEPRRARMSVPRDGLYAVLRRIMYVFCLLSFNVQRWSDVS